MSAKATASSSSVPRATRRPLPRLHVVAGDEIVAADDFRDRLAPLLEAGGASLAVQIRARATPARRVYDVARWLVAASATEGATVIVSDRLDNALASGAGGVHLREDSMPVPVARQVAEAVSRAVGASLLVGRSIHAPAQAAEPWTGAADYLVFGSVWATKSHPGRVPAGPEALAEAAERARVPALAIGGVVPETTAAAVELGAYGVVVRSGVWNAACPASAAIRYLEALGASSAMSRSPPRGRSHDTENEAGTGDEE